MKPKGAYLGNEESFHISAMSAVRNIVREAEHDPRCAMHIPNGGARDVVTGSKMKSAGVVRGYPDIMIFAREGVPPINRRKSHIIPRCGLAIELKVWPNKPNKEQEQVHELLRAAGWRVVTCWSLDAIIEECNRYINGEWMR